MKHFFSRWITASLLLGAAPVFGDTWPQFRGPAGDGHAKAKNLPLEWSEDKGVAWKTAIPGRGWSSPVIAGGKVYLTTAVAKNGDEDSLETDRSLRTLCLDAATGKVVWDVEVFVQDGARSPKSIHKKNSHASPTPIWDNGKLYVHYGHEGTACLDPATGKKLWENREFFYSPLHGNGSSPILVEGKLVFSCDGDKEQFVLALDASNGKVAWKFTRATEAKRKFAFATPAYFDINGRKQIISPGADVVNSLDPATGKEIWRVSYEGYSVVPKPLFSQGIVYVATSFDTPDVLAIRPEGTGDITSTAVVWEMDQTKRTPKTCSMLAEGDLLYWVSDNGIFSCVDAKTGESHYNERVGGEFSASPFLAGDRIYIQDERGSTIVLKTGKTFEKLAQNTLDTGRTYASHAVADGAIYLRGEKALYCLGQPISAKK